MFSSRRIAAERFLGARIFQCIQKRSGSPVLDLLLAPQYVSCVSGNRGGDVSASSDGSKVALVEVVQEFHCRCLRRLWIKGQRLLDRVAARPIAIVADAPEDLLGDVLLFIPFKKISNFNN